MIAYDPQVTGLRVNRLTHTYDRDARGFAKPGSRLTGRTGQS
jgi:hypothetical protein